MYEGWLSFGGNELINNERVRGYGETADCPMTWLKGPRCTDLITALQVTTPWRYESITEAPWFDPAMPLLSARFFGAFGISVRGIPDSTRTVGITQGITDGGTIGRQRDAVREVQVRAMIIAQGADALDYGMAWLDATLDPGACGQHGTECGLTDLEFFVDCPPGRGQEPVNPNDPSQGTRPQTDEEYAATVNTYRRYLHDVATISGPMVVGEFEAWGFHAYMVEFVLAAERPWVYSITRELGLSPSLPVVVQDIPYNLAKYPSAELEGAAVIVGRNYSQNPSVETNATLWTASADPVSGANATPYLTQGRVSGELQAVGTASFRARILGNGSTAVSGRTNLWAFQSVPLTTLGAGERVSLQIWAAALILAGSGGSAIQSIVVDAQFRNAGGTTLGTVVLGTATPADYGGKAYSLKSQAVPTGTDNVLVRVHAIVDWASSATPANNSDIRLYADALAVTVP
jgi:hypothetical protein